jgi:transposase-like protein
MAKAYTMSDSVGYPRCPICNSGYLLPVVLGGGGEKDVKYRCTDPECGVRFDKHGFERYDTEKQDFVRMREY